MCWRDNIIRNWITPRSLQGSTKFSIAAAICDGYCWIITSHNYMRAFRSRYDVDGELSRYRRHVAAIGDGSSSFPTGERVRGDGRSPCSWTETVRDDEQEKDGEEGDKRRRPHPQASKSSISKANATETLNRPWLIDWLIDWLSIDWLIDWLTDDWMKWLIQWLIVRLMTDWLID